jgi:hypothetical protein
MNQKEKKFRKTFEKMEGFSFVTSVTGLNRPNTGKDDDDDDDDIYSCNCSYTPTLAISTYIIPI